jgi:hypothetical protein
MKVAFKARQDSGLVTVMWQKTTTDASSVDGIGDTLHRPEA